MNKEFCLIGSANPDLHSLRLITSLRTNHCGFDYTPGFGFGFEKVKQALVLFQALAEAVSLVFAFDAWTWELLSRPF